MSNRSLRILSLGTGVQSTTPPGLSRTATALCVERNYD